MSKWNSPDTLSPVVTLDVIRTTAYYRSVILGYRDARTERFARGERVKPFEAFRRKAEMTLDRLGAATNLADIAHFPGHRLEKLKGDRKGQWSIRINNQWRICFRWDEGAAGPAEVEIVDYH